MTTKQCLITIGGIVGSLFVVAVIVSQALFITNVNLAVYAEQISDLERQNKEIEVSVARLESVETILPLAKAQGFSDNSPVLYLNTTDKLARNE